jgi:hypothetical protein
MLLFIIGYQIFLVKSFRFMGLMQIVPSVKREGDGIQKNLWGGEPIHTATVLRTAAGWLKKKRVACIILPICITISL